MGPAPRGNLPLRRQRRLAGEAGLQGAGGRSRSGGGRGRRLLRVQLTPSRAASDPARMGSRRAGPGQEQSRKNLTREREVVRLGLGKGWDQVQSPWPNSAVSQRNQVRLAYCSQSFIFANEKSSPKAEAVHPSAPAVMGRIQVRNGTCSLRPYHPERADLI